MDYSCLNNEQKRAVTTTDGPLLILAGAGSGKTRTLTYRVAHLISQGVPPWSIMAITFTNKAATEMRDRIQSMVGTASEDIWISTFHSSCARILRKDIEKLGYNRSFTIYDDDDQLNVIKECLHKLNYDEKILPIRMIKSTISDAKNHLWNPEEWFAHCTRGFNSQRVYEVYLAYERELKNSNALDFDDLIMKTLELFMACPPVLEYYQIKFRYIHVDEYQDTNYAQYMFIRLLSEKSHNLCVVGDDDQSIYGWRGADINNILDFEKDYPDATVIKLEQNYRSTSNILDAANQVIAQNENRKEKRLWTDKGQGAPIVFCRLADEKAEASWIVEKTLELNKNGMPFSDIGILYRTNAQSRVLEEAIIRNSLKYRIYGGMRFYERKEIKDILAYLKLLINPADDVALRRIINVPKRSIGETTLRQLTEYAASQGIPLLSACLELPDTLGNRARKSIQQFSDIIMQLSVLVHQASLNDIVRTVLSVTDFEKQFSDKDEESQSRIENIREFIGAVDEYENRNSNPSLNDFLESISLVNEIDESSDEREALTLMTLHSAKGLEFPCVFIAGMEENLFPSSRSLDDPVKLEEERRLCYVGITRAKSNLFLTCAQRRMLYNQLQFNERSRFIESIPSRVIVDATSSPSYSTSVNRLMSFGKDSYGYMESVQKETIRSLTRKCDSSLNSWLNQNRENHKSTVSNRKYNDLANVHTSAKSASNRSVNKATANTPYTVGERILHKRFGKGSVLRVTAENNSQRILVRFDDSRIGIKQLALELAPIIRIDS